MKFLAAILVATTAVLAQLQGSNEGPNIAAGASLVANPNFNAGLQAQSSLFDGSVSGANVIGGEVFGSFGNKPTNDGTMDSNLSNPSESGISGNVGSTANGALNNMLEFALGSSGPMGGGGLRRRDAVLNNGPVPVNYLYPVSIRGRLVYPYRF
ncbi:hypothetical protein H4S06_002836 [Coemansia sp. BCRC 34490]|nr:hypothetical protein H4S06_002836 [Coemansia sp. BCRC 34490]